MAKRWAIHRAGEVTQHGRRGVVGVEEKNVSHFVIKISEK